MEKTTVLIVDRIPVIREGLKSMLQSDDAVEVIGEAADSPEAAAKVDELDPDIILLGPHVLAEDGFEDVRRAKALHPTTAIIVISSLNDDAQLVDALKAGVTGFLPANVCGELLCHTIQVARSGCALVESSLLQRFVAVGVEPSLSARGCEPKHRLPQASSLTARELDVLRLLVDGHSNKGIGASLLITEDTVKKHVQSIIGKLHASDRTHAAVKALRYGLVD